MAELSNHSYHYKSSLLNVHHQESPSRRSSEDSSSKKKPRRRKRMLTGVSKQRRAANERERKRLQIINMAFKDLKSTLPLFPNEDNISKIEIVRLASRTIKYLADMLNKDNLNDLDHHARSPGGSESSEQSESSLSNSGDLLSDLEATILDASIDMTALLFPAEDFKFTAFCAQPSDLSSLSDIDGSSLSSTDGFNGLDINSFIDANDTDGSDDVFPSMLYL